jgi:hypothetical protein
MVDIISHIFILNKGYSTTNMRELGHHLVFLGERIDTSCKLVY